MWIERFVCVLCANLYWELKTHTNLTRRTLLQQINEIRLNCKMSSCAGYVKCESGDSKKNAIKRIESRKHPIRWRYIYFWLTVCWFFPSFWLQFKFKRHQRCLRRELLRFWLFENRIDAHRTEERKKTPTTKRYSTITTDKLKLSITILDSFFLIHSFFWSVFLFYFERKTN